MYWYDNLRHSEKLILWILWNKRFGILSTRNLGFMYVSSEGRVGCEFIHQAQPTDAPSSRRSSRFHFYTLGVAPCQKVVARSLM
jgi:hypothetical protein